MPSPTAIRAGQAYVEVGARTTALERGLRAAEAKLKAFGKSLKTIGTGLAGLAAPVTAGLGAAVKIFTDVGGTLTDIRDRTGMTIEAWTALAAHFAAAGADAQTLELAVRRMQTFLASAAGGSTDAAEALALLGLRVEDLLQLRPDQQLERLGEALAQVRHEAQRTQLAQALFGKGGTKLLPGFAAGVGAGRQRAADLGLVVTNEQAEMADRLGDQFGFLAGQVKMVAFQVGAALAPQLERFVAWAQPTLASVMQWIRDNQELVGTVALVAGGLTALGGILVAVGAGATALSAALGAVAAIAAFLVTPIGALVAVGAALAVAFGPDLWSDVGGWWAWGRDLIVQVWDRIRAEIQAAGVTWELFKEQAIFAIESIPTVLKWLWNSLKAFALWLWDNWPQVFVETAKTIGQVFTSLGRMAQRTWEEIVGIFEGRWPDFSALGAAFADELAKIGTQARRIVAGLDLPALDLSQVNPERLARIRELQRQRQEILDQALEEFARQRAAPAGAAARAAAQAGQAPPWLQAAQQIQDGWQAQGAFAAAAVRSLAVGDSLARQQVDLLGRINDHLAQIERNTDQAFE